MTTGRRLRAVVSIGGEVSRSLPTSARRASQELDRLAQAQARDRREAQRLRLEMRSLSRSSQAYGRAVEQQRQLRERMAERGVQIRDLAAQSGQATGVLGRFGATMGQLGPWGAAAGAGIGLAAAAVYGLGRAIGAEAQAARRIEDISITTGASEQDVYALTRGLQTLTTDYDDAQSAAAAFFAGQSRIRLALAGQGDLGFAVELAYAGLTPEEVRGDLDDVVAAVQGRLAAGVTTDVLVRGLSAADFGDSASLIVALAESEERLAAARRGMEAADLGDLSQYNDWREASSALRRELSELRTQGVGGLTEAITPAVARIAEAIDVAGRYRGALEDAGDAADRVRELQSALASAETPEDQARIAGELAAALDASALASRRATEAGNAYGDMLEAGVESLYEWIAGSDTAYDELQAMWGALTRARDRLREWDEQLRDVPGVLSAVAGGIRDLAAQQFDQPTIDASAIDAAVDDIEDTLSSISSPVIDLDIDLSALRQGIDTALGWLDRIPGVDIDMNVPSPVYGPVRPPDLEEIAASVQELPSPVYGPVRPPDLEEIAASVQELPSPVYGPVRPPDLEEIAASVQELPSPVYGPVRPPDLEEIAASVQELPSPVYGPVRPPDLEEIAASAQQLPSPVYGPVRPPDLEEIAASVQELPSPVYGPVRPPDLEEIAASVQELPSPVYGPVRPPDLEEIAASAQQLPSPVYGPVRPPDLEEIAASVQELPSPVYGPVRPPDLEEIAASVQELPSPVYGPVRPPDLEEIAASAQQLPSPVYGPVRPPDLEEIAASAQQLPSPVYGPVRPPDLEEIAARRALTPGADLSSELTIASDDLISALAELTLAVNRADRPQPSPALSSTQPRIIEQHNTYSVSGQTDLDAALRLIEESTLRQVEALA